MSEIVPRQIPTASQATPGGMAIQQEALSEIRILKIKNLLERFLVCVTSRPAEPLMWRDIYGTGDTIVIRERSKNEPLEEHTPQKNSTNAMSRTQN